MTTRTLRTAATLAALAIAGTASAQAWPVAAGALDNPGGLVTWERGVSNSSINTAYAQWDVLYNASGAPNYADDGVFGGTAATFDDTSLLGKPNEGSGATAGTGVGAATLTQTTSGPFIIGSGATGNIYSFATPESFVLDLAGFAITDPGVGNSSFLVITTLTSGNELDYASMFNANGATLVATNELYRSAPGSQGSDVAYQWKFDVTGLSDSDLIFTFDSGANTSVSFQKLSVDAFVPSAPTTGVFAAAGLMAARRRRRA